MYFLTDEEIFSPKGKKLFQIQSLNYALGHAAIRSYFDIEHGVGANCWQADFWEIKTLPPQIAEKIGNFDKNFGRTFKECFWFYNLYDIFNHPNVTPKWRQLAWRQILVLEKEDWSFCSIIAAQRNGIVPNEWKEKAWIELIRRGIKNKDTLHYLAINAPAPWSEKARRLAEKKST